MWRLKAAEAALTALGGYVRYSPLDLGKSSAWKLLEQYVLWRSDLRPRVAETRFGFKLQLQPPDLIQTVILLSGVWEPLLTKCVVNSLGTGDVVVDIGANIGYYSLLASERVGIEGKVYAVEASPSIFERLQGNIGLNPRNCVAAVNALVSNTSGKQPFYLGPAGNLGRSTSNSSIGTEPGFHLEGHIAACPVTDVVPERDLFGARLIKIDVEGGERQVLETIVPRLREFSERTMWVVELTPQLSIGGQADIDWICECFWTAGYRAYRVPNVYPVDVLFSEPATTPMKELKNPPTSQADVIFSR